MLGKLIHDGSRNGVFRSSVSNQLLQILFANLPIVFPGAIRFRIDHLVHHRYQGEPSLDADLAPDLEVRFEGRVG